MKSFEPLLSLLATIPDPRRAEGKLYQLRHVLLFSIFAMISGANSYRSLRTYFRVHRQRLNDGDETCVIAFDGKTLKGSFDNFNDRKARQVLSAFAADTGLVLAHIEIDEKSNEIPAMQKLLQELGLAGHIATADAIHCQKNI